MLPWSWIGRATAQQPRPAAGNHGHCAATDADIDPQSRLAWAMSHGLWEEAAQAAQSGVDPNRALAGGLTPFLMAAWAGQAALLRRLHGLGGRPGPGFQGKSLLDLALESRDGDTIACSLELGETNPAPPDPRGRLMRQAQGLGLAGTLSRLMAREARRRREAVVNRLEHGLPAANQARGRERL